MTTIALNHMTTQRRLPHLSTPHEWRSGQRARVRSGAEGTVRAVTEGVAWVEFFDGEREFNARIPLERLIPVDGAVLAAREALERDAAQFGGIVVESPCPECGAVTQGHVVVDPGEAASSSGPAVPAQLYVAGFIRSCNCNVERATVERELIVQAATKYEAQ